MLVFVFLTDAATSVDPEPCNRLGRLWSLGHVVAVDCSEGDHHTGPAILRLGGPYERLVGPGVMPPFAQREANGRVTVARTVHELEQVAELAQRA